MSDFVVNDFDLHSYIYSDFLKGEKVIFSKVHADSVCQRLSSQTLKVFDLQEFDTGFLKDTVLLNPYPEHFYVKNPDEVWKIFEFRIWVVLEP